MAGWIKTWLDRWMVRHVDGWIDEWMDAWINKCFHEWMDGWMDMFDLMGACVRLHEMRLV